MLKSFLPWENREYLPAPCEIRLYIYRIYRLNSFDVSLHLIRRLLSGFQLHSSQASLILYFSEPYADPQFNNILYTFMIQLIQDFFFFLSGGVFSHCILSGVIYLAAQI